MKDNVHNRTSKYETLKYYPDGGVQIDRENIMTLNKMVYPNHLYLKVQDRKFVVIKVLEIWDANGFVYLRVQDQDGTGREYEISQILNPQIKHFKWWIADYDYFMRVLEQRIMMQLIVGNTTNDNGLLEFDF